jgi:hypothetical protein
MTESGARIGFVEVRLEMKKALISQGFHQNSVVGARGFEPPTPASRTQYSTRLSYAPTETTTALEGPSNSEEG